jgi:hypothetical protein
MKTANKKTDEIDRPFFYAKVSWRDALSQWWHGRCDGRRALPIVKSDREIVVVPPTPHDGSLLQRRSEVTQRERQRLIERSDRACQQIAECYQQIELVAVEQQRNEAALQQADQPPSQAELHRRGPSEEQFNDEVIRHRRAAERDKRLAPVRDAVRTNQGKLDALYNQLASLEAGLTNDVRKAQSRAMQYCAFTDRLRARYWRTLVRVHPERKRMVAAVPPCAPVPEWITESDYRVVLDIKLPSSGSIGDQPLPETVIQ